MGRKPIDLTGQKFGRLTVIERDSTKPRGTGLSAYWIYQCECGNIKLIEIPFTDYNNLSLEYLKHIGVME